jgi:hypothetical protein
VSLPSDVFLASLITDLFGFVCLLRIYIGLPICIAMGIFCYRKESEHLAHIDHEMSVPNRPLPLAPLAASCRTAMTEADGNAIVVLSMMVDRCYRSHHVARLSSTRPVSSRPSSWEGDAEVTLKRPT